MENRVSLYSNCLSKSPEKQVKLLSKFTLDVDIALKAIHAYERGGKDDPEYQAIKKRVPAVTPSSFSDVRNADACIQQHSGVMGIDLDGFDGDADLLATLAKLRNSEHILVAGWSLSQSGIHAFARVDPIPTKISEHRDAWHAVNDVVQRLTGREMDAATKDCSRLFFFSHDKSAIATARIDARPIKWTPKVNEFVEVLPGEIRNTDANGRPPSPENWREHRLLGRQEQGGRNTMLMKFGGDIQMQLGWTDDQVRDALTNANFEFCSPPLDEKEMDAIVGSVLSSQKAAPFIPVGLSVNQGRQVQQPPPATVENIEIPDIYEVGILGRWVGARCHMDGFHVAYDETSATYFKASKTHWERVLWPDIRRRLDAVYTPMILEHAGERVGHFAQILQNDQENTMAKAEAKKWRENFSIAKHRQPLSRTGFSEGVEAMTTRTLDDPPGHLIATQSGIVDVKTQTILPFDPSVHNHKSCAAVAWTADDFTREFKTWQNFCANRFKSAEMANYAKRIFGAATIGEVERIYVLLLGPAGCGKTTFMRCLLTVLASYAMTVSGELFDPRGNHNSQKCDMLERDVRLAVLAEGNDARIQADEINMISGGDTMTARRPYGRKEVTGKSKCLPVIYAESAPSLRKSTQGTMERQRILSFKPLSAEDRDLSIKDAANDPHSPLCRGAFAWLLAGACEYLEHGIGPIPSDMAEDSNDALETQDELAYWIKTSPIIIIGSQSAEIADAYNGTLEENSRYKLSANAMGRALKRWGYEQKKKRIKGESKRGWYPIETDTQTDLIEE